MSVFDHTNQPYYAVTDFNPASAANAKANVTPADVNRVLVPLNRLTFLSPPSISLADTGTEPRAAVRRP